MRSNNFPDKELLAQTPDMEGVTRPEKNKKTKKFTFLVSDFGNPPMKLTTYAENKVKAIKYVKSRWKDCNCKLID